MLRLILPILVLCLTASAVSAADRIYNAQTATLENGMQVVVVPIHRTPAVTHMVWYKAGSGEEQEGAHGVAHFLEHLMFKGTPHIPVGKFSELIQQMGGNDNAFTSWDYTAYFQTVPKEKLADVMRMESERMNDMTPAFKDIVSEKEVVIEERRQNVESSPGAGLAEKMRKALFGDHPYGRPILGEMKEMQALKWIDGLAFYKRWYAPNNAILVISGDVTLDEVLPLANETYGKLPREGDFVQRERPAIKPLEKDALITYARPDVRQPVWEYMVRAPSARQDAKQALALNVLADLLSGATGRLYQDLVVKNKIATSINAGYDDTAWDDGTFAIYATPVEGVAMDRLGTEVTRVLNDIAQTGFTPQEIKESIARQQDEAVYAMDSLAGPAMSIGYALASGSTLEDVETWPARLETVDNAQVLAALKTNVLAVHGVTGWLLPQDREGAAQ